MPSPIVRKGGRGLWTPRDHKRPHYSQLLSHQHPRKMSMFGIGGGGSGAGPSHGGVNSNTIDVAVAELDMITDVFNKLVSYASSCPYHQRLMRLTIFLWCRSCHSKCIGTRYSEPDLNKGESVCVDRCVAKFFEVNKKVGERLQTSEYKSSSRTARTLTLFSLLYSGRECPSFRFVVTVFHQSQMAEPH